jgi:hypothetical protein
MLDIGQGAFEMFGQVGLPPDAIIYVQPGVDPPGILGIKGIIV